MKTTATLILLLLLSAVATTHSATDSFVFGGCSQLKFIPGSPYENNVDSLLTSVVNAAVFTSYNNYSFPGAIASDTLYGLFQCRGDLSNRDCFRCVSKAVSQLGTLCAGSVGGALQLSGCFVKYDNVSFLGAEDKALVAKKCGSLVAAGSDATGRRDSVLGYIGSNDGSYKPYRVGGSGDVQGVAQCTGDLSAGECQDCVSEAIGRLKTECGYAKWGEVYLGKCYVTYSVGGDHSHGGHDSSGNDNDDDDEIEKTLAILIGLIAAVALIIVFLSFLSKICDNNNGKGGR